MDIGSTDSPTFKVGSKIVHSVHGPGEIVDETKEVLYGCETTFFVLQFAQSTLKVATTGSGMKDLRLTESTKTLDSVIATLKAAPKKKSGQWMRVMQDYIIEVHSGDLNRIATVVRDLYRKPGHLRTTTEEQLYMQSLDFLVREIGQIRSEDTDAVLAFLHASCPGNSYTLAAYTPAIINKPGRRKGYKSYQDVPPKK